MDKDPKLSVYLKEGERELIEAAAELENRTMSNWANVVLVREAKSVLEIQEGLEDDTGGQEEDEWRYN